MSPGDARDVWETDLPEEMNKEISGIVKNITCSLYASGRDEVAPAIYIYIYEV